MTRCIWSNRIYAKMFNDLDKSPFDDSTGLKFVEYLTRKADANQRVPRSRKQLFRLAEVDATADEFSIRNIVEKENTAVETRASAQSVKKTQTPTAARQERSSLFVRIVMHMQMLQNAYN